MGRRMIDRIVTMRDGEAATAVMMFAYSFLAMTSYNILKPITRSQFISALGADNLPYVQLGAGLLIGVLMQCYSKGAEDASRLLRRHLRDPEPRIAVTAAVILADSDTNADACAGEAALAKLVEEVSPTVRREVAAALACVKNARCSALLVLLIHDADIDVARVAIRSAHMLTPVDLMFVPALVGRLGHRVLKPVARNALITYGDHACDVLAHVLNDSQENRWVRRHVPGTLARIPTQRSLDVLVEMLSDPDGFLRFKALAAVEQLHCHHGHLLVNREVIERRLLEEANRYHAVLTLRFNLVRHDTMSERSIVERALDDKLQRIVDRVFRLLGLIHPWQEVDAARRALGHLPAIRAGPLVRADVRFLPCLALAQQRCRRNAVATLQPGSCGTDEKRCPSRGFLAEPPPSRLITLPARLRASERRGHAELLLIPPHGTGTSRSRHARPQFVCS